MKGKELLLIAVSSFILTVIWIASNVYHAYATSTLDSLLQAQIVPIPPTFDMDTIAKIRERTVIVPQSIAPTPEPQLLSPTPTPIQEELSITPSPTEAITPTEILVPSETTTPSVATPTELTPAAP
jgi:hypothetical protein